MKNTNLINENDEDKRGSQGSQEGEIKFRYKDIFSSDPRDDLLPEDKIRHLLVQHENLHKDSVDKQREIRKERGEIKKNSHHAHNLQAGLRGGMGGGGGVSNYKTHPISQYAQFSGATDRKVSNIPSEDIAETNKDMKNQLDLRLQNQLRVTHTYHPPILRR